MNNYLNLIIIYQNNILLTTNKEQFRKCNNFHNGAR